jgi:hypothetical protein
MSRGEVVQSIRDDCKPVPESIHKTAVCLLEEHRWAFKQRAEHCSHYEMEQSHRSSEESTRGKCGV